MKRLGGEQGPCSPMPRPRALCLHVGPKKGSTPPLAVRATTPGQTPSNPTSRYRRPRALGHVRLPWKYVRPTTQSLIPRLLPWPPVSEAVRQNCWLRTLRWNEGMRKSSSGDIRPSFHPVLIMLSLFTDFPFSSFPQGLGATPWPLASPPYRIPQ
jgi:hypothetical protein